MSVGSYQILALQVYLTYKDSIALLVEDHMSLISETDKWFCRYSFW